VIDKRSEILASAALVAMSVDEKLPLDYSHRYEFRDARLANSVTNNFGRKMMTLVAG
jgi:hypothetical protein